MVHCASVKPTEDSRCLWRVQCDRSPTRSSSLPVLQMVLWNRFITLRYTPCDSDDGSSWAYTRNCWYPKHLGWDLCVQLYTNRLETCNYWIQNWWATTQLLIIFSCSRTFWPVGLCQLLTILSQLPTQLWASTLSNVQWLQQWLSWLYQWLTITSSCKHLIAVLCAAVRSNAYCSHCCHPNLVGGTEAQTSDGGLCRLWLTQLSSKRGTAPYPVLKRVSSNGQASSVRGSHPRHSNGAKVDTWYCSHSSWRIRPCSGSSHDEGVMQKNATKNCMS